MDNFVAEIRLFPYTFAPKGWALCAGQILPISQNTALFSLVGTTYGGNGISNFALPDLRDAVAIGQGSSTSLGQQGGEATVALTVSQMPSHTHGVVADNNFRSANAADPTGAELGNAAPLLAYSSAAPAPASLVAMHPAMLGASGTSSAHNNMMPFVAATYCIALTGIFPPRS